MISLVCTPRQVSLLVEASLLLGQGVICIPFMAIVIWSIPDVTVERVEEAKNTEGSLEHGNPVASEATSIKGDEKPSSDAETAVPVLKSD